MSDSIAAYLMKSYKEGSQECQILYKYRTFNQYSIENLQKNAIWFSSYELLNDPFDCHIRLPVQLSPLEIEHLRQYTSPVEGKRLDIVGDQQEFMELISTGHAFKPFEIVASMAKQIGLEGVKKHFGEKVTADDKWLTKSFTYAHRLQSEYLSEMGVFCLSEKPDCQLMWAHYGDSHKGYCVGYISPTGIDSPRLIHKMQYSKTMPEVDVMQLVGDPGQVYMNLILTKPHVWNYEQEWRLTFGGFIELEESPLPINEVIFGMRMPTEQKRLVKAALSGKDIVFKEVFSALTENRQYCLAIRDLD